MREFNAKFFPPLVQERKEDEFIRLRQGAQSVAEYESQFTPRANHDRATADQALYPGPERGNTKGPRGGTD